MSHLSRPLLRYISATTCREEAWAELGGYTVWDKPHPSRRASMDPGAGGAPAAPPLVPAPGSDEDEGNPHLAAVDRALAVLEAPLMAARRATIPLVSREQVRPRPEETLQCVPSESAGLHHHIIEYASDCSPHPDTLRQS